MEEITKQDASTQANLQRACAAALNTPRPALQNDPSLLLIRGKNGENKQYIKSLSHATLTVVAKYGYANLKCVGASAINNAIKAIVIASGDAKTKGIDLVISPSFQDAEFIIDGQSVEKTAILLTVYDR